MTSAAPRVLIVFSSSQLGGAERSVTRMASAADKSKVTFELATLDGDGPWVAWSRALRWSPIVLGETNRPDRHGKFGFGEVLKLVRRVRDEGYDAIYVIGLRASLAVRLAKPFLAGARIVHGVRWNPDSGSRLDVAFRFIERVLGGLVDHYICNSHAAKRTIETRVGTHPSKITTIHNGLDRLPKDISATSTRPRNIVTIANISARKGYLQYLEQVAGPVSAQNAEVTFVIAGRDDMGGSLQRKIAELGLENRVKFCGFVDDVDQVLRNAYAFVLPSLWNEGCPTAVIEAMAYQVPVIAFSGDGVPELVDDRQEGKLTERGDYAGLISGLTAVLDCSDIADKLGRNGRARVEKEFLTAYCAQKHQEVFEALTQTSD